MYCLLKTYPAVTYEMDYYIFEKAVIFVLSRADKVQNRNFWTQKTIIRGKRNLDNIMDP